VFDRHLLPDTVHMASFATKMTLLAATAMCTGLSARCFSAFNLRNLSFSNSRSASSSAASAAVVVPALPQQTRPSP
jgi:hypothetical protein